MKSLNSLDHNIIGVALAAAAILLVPLVAMQFSDKVVWTLFDFLIAWVLLFGAGLTFKLVTDKKRSLVYRAAFGAAVGTSLFLVWLNLAVGLIGSEENPANLMYAGVLIVAFLGAIIARLRADRMVVVMLFVVAAQALTAVIALALGLSPASSVIEISGVNVLFMVMWSGSAFLFWLEARNKKTIHLPDSMDGFF